MVVDTSALVAILLGEDEAEPIARALLDSPRRLISTVTALETDIVIEARKGSDGGREWELLFLRLELELVPLSTAQRTLAMEAWRRFGKGRHKAALNIGDCCSYALSVQAQEPLLYKGDDFASTDVSRVTW